MWYPQAWVQDLHKFLQVWAGAFRFVILVVTTRLGVDILTIYLVSASASLRADIIAICMVSASLPLNIVNTCMIS